MAGPACFPPHSTFGLVVGSMDVELIMFGNMANYVKRGTGLFGVCTGFFGWVLGGLAVSSVLATAGFAEVSGAAVAAAAVFAR